MPSWTNQNRSEQELYPLGSHGMVQAPMATHVTETDISGYPMYQQMGHMQEACSQPYPLIDTSRAAQFPSDLPQSYHGGAVTMPSNPPTDPECQEAYYCSGYMFQPVPEQYSAASQDRWTDDTPYHNASNPYSGYQYQTTPMGCYPQSSYPADDISTLYDPLTPMEPETLKCQYSPDIEEEPSYYRATEFKESGKELVGMGLYDEPEKPTPRTSLFNSYNAAYTVARPVVPARERKELMGKGLVLEETWQPPLEDAEAEDDDESTEGSGEELLPSLDGSFEDFDQW
ncbi:MAG: hypothetical protein M1819_000331 [Sarea resinae]|nr:MAG: hypothetical protein M1819_000331 [Sarea resinae]